MADPQPTGPAPEPSIRLPLVISVLVLMLWLVVTVSSPWLAPLIAKQVERVEVAMGWDVLPGWPEGERDE